VPRFAGEQCFRRLLQTQSIKRFDDPALCAAAAREMHVRMTIEEHQHGDVRDALVAVIEAQVHRHRHRTHRSELQIEHREIGHSTLDGFGNIPTVRADHE